MYKYDLNNNYYKVIGDNKLKKITKKEYLEKTGDKLENINKLKKSVYPSQYRNYIMLKFPSYFPVRIHGKYIKGKYVPVDWKLANIIKILWKNKIITYGWDQGYKTKINNKIYQDNGFIAVGNINIDGKDTVKILQKILGNRKLKIFNYIENSKLNKNICKKYPNNVCILINKDVIYIEFSHSLILYIHKKMNIKIPSEKKALKGNKVIMNNNKYIIV